MKFRSVIYGLAAWLLASCATQVAPSGGPEDKLPPRVAGVYPAPNTTNHPNELLVKLEFDEWINASIPRSAVSISPPIEKKLRFEVHGKSLLLTSRAELDTGTTYTVTFAGGIKDLRGNALAKPFQVVFSTGAVIDSLTLSGRVLVTEAMARKKEYPSVGLFLMGPEREHRRFLDKYRDTATKALDSLPMLLKEPPLYLTRADSAGDFTLTGLKPGRYRVVAFSDVNGNQKIELSTEQAGIWTSDLELTDQTSDTLWIAVADMDTTHLELESVSQPFANVLEAKFSRNVYFDSLFADTSNCYLQTPEKENIYPRWVYRGSNSNQPQFYFEPTPKSETLYKFICNSGMDSLSRTLDTTRNEVEWEWKKMEQDTLPPAVVNAVTVSKAATVFPDDSMLVIFNKPKLDSLENEFFLLINKDTIPVKVLQIDPVRFAVVKPSPWATDINITLLKSRKDTTLAAADSNGIRDTVVELKYESVRKFETVSKLKLASLQGKIPGAKHGTVVRLRSVESGTSYIEHVGAAGDFKFGGLVEGGYFMDYYYPENGKLLPEAGSITNFRFGRPWRAISDTLKISNGENDLEKIIPAIPALPY